MMEKRLYGKTGRKSRLCLAALLLAALLLFQVTASATTIFGAWRLDNYTAETGEVVADQYITNTYLANGSYSNAAVTNGKAYLALLIDKTLTYIQLFEQSTSAPIKARSTTQYTIRIGEASGITSEFSGTMYQNGNRIIVDNAVEFSRVLRTNPSVKILVRNIGTVNTTYLFESFSLAGFQDAETALYGNRIPATGWAEINGKRYYYSGGRRLTGFQTIDGIDYCFDPDGALYGAGLHEADGKTYFLTDAGVALKGWYTINDKPRYFFPWMAASYAYYIDNALYCFNADGTLFQNGWFQSGTGAFFYTDYSGTSSLGWKPGEKSCFYITGSATGQATEVKYPTIALPDGTVSVESGAFEGASMQILVIPKTCRSVNSRAFADCANLKFVIYYPASTGIAADAFANDHCVFLAGP